MQRIQLVGLSRENLLVERTSSLELALLVEGECALQSVP